LEIIIYIVLITHPTTNWYP